MYTRNRLQLEHSSTPLTATAPMIARRLFFGAHGTRSHIAFMHIDDPGSNWHSTAVDVAKVVETAIKYFDCASIWVKMMFLDSCYSGMSEAGENDILAQDNCIATWQVENVRGQVTQVYGHIDAPPAVTSHRRAATARAHFLSL